MGCRFGGSSPSPGAQLGYRPYCEAAAVSNAQHVAYEILQEIDRRAALPTTTAAAVGEALTAGAPAASPPVTAATAAAASS